MNNWTLKKVFEKSINFVLYFIILYMNKFFGI